MGVGIAPTARVPHDYEFTKGDYKWFYLERNRWWTLLGVYPGTAPGAARARPARRRARAPARRMARRVAASEAARAGRGRSCAAGDVAPPARRAGHAPDRSESLRVAAGGLAGLAYLEGAARAPGVDAVQRCYWRVVRRRSGSGASRARPAVPRPRRVGRPRDLRARAHGGHSRAARGPTCDCLRQPRDGRHRARVLARPGRQDRRPARRLGPGPAPLGPRRAGDAAARRRARGHRGVALPGELRPAQWSVRSRPDPARPHLPAPAGHGLDAASVGHRGDGPAGSAACAPDHHRLRCGARRHRR